MLRNLIEICVLCSSVMGDRMYGNGTQVVSPIGTVTDNSMGTYQAKTIPVANSDSDQLIDWRYESDGFVRMRRNPDNGGGAIELCLTNDRLDGVRIRGCDASGPNVRDLWRYSTDTGELMSKENRWCLTADSDILTTRPCGGLHQSFSLKSKEPRLLKFSIGFPKSQFLAFDRHSDDRVFRNVWESSEREYWTLTRHNYIRAENSSFCLTTDDPHSPLQVVPCNRPNLTRFYPEPLLSSNGTAIRIRAALVPKNGVIHKDFCISGVDHLLAPNLLWDCEHYSTTIIPESSDYEALTNRNLFPDGLYVIYHKQDRFRTHDMAANVDFRGSVNDFDEAYATWNLVNISPTSFRLLNLGWAHSVFEVNYHIMYTDTMETAFKLFLHANQPLLSFTAEIEAAGTFALKVEKCNRRDWYLQQIDDKNSLNRSQLRPDYLPDNDLNIVEYETTPFYSFTNVQFFIRTGYSYAPRSGKIEHLPEDRGSWMLIQNKYTLRYALQYNHPVIRSACLVTEGSREILLPNRACNKTSDYEFIFLGKFGLRNDFSEVHITSVHPLRVEPISLVLSQNKLTSGFSEAYRFRTIPTA